MKIIISEKAIAGNRIAKILSNNNAKLETEKNAQIIKFEKDGTEYNVIPLRGHITDVDFPQRYSYWIGTDLKKLTEAPIEYKGIQKSIISLLKSKGKEAEEVIIATDADREGEAIGVEALNYIREVNPDIKVKRSYFSAITPKDINNAFSNLTQVDFNFADSADARREIDLIWGAVLTRYLSLVSGRLGKEFLSAGRVQTPVLAILVKREKERLAFKAKKYWVVSALFSKDKKDFLAEHKEGKFWEQKDAEKVMELKNEKKGQVIKITKTKRTLKKPIPFNTTGFLRASSAIGISASEAMNIAESLYMSGYISYPRTDNSIYPENLDLREILNNLVSNPEFVDHADKLLKKEKLEPSKGKESKDHPPIHPVTSIRKEKLSGKYWKVYELICRRFFATLAEDAQTNNISADISVKNEIFVAKGQTLVKPGWKEFYPYSVTKEVILPELKEKEFVDLKKMDIEEKETQPPNRYSQGSLIKRMEDLNLGTKSTRPTILQKLYFRKYISGLKSLEPNKISFAVIDSLDKYNAQIEKPELTADIEKEMDLIAAGKKTKKEIVEKSRKILLKSLNNLIDHKDKIGSELRSALKEDSMLMDCDKCKDGTLRMLKGRTGKRFLGCTNYPKCTNSYPLPQEGNIKALEEKCETCGKPTIHVSKKRVRYKMCIDPKCPSKADWGKKKDKKTIKNKTGSAEAKASKK